MASPGRNKNDISMTLNEYDVKGYQMNDSNTSRLVANHSMIDLEESLLGDGSIVFNPEIKSTPRKNKFSGGVKRKTRRNKKGKSKGNSKSKGKGKGNSKGKGKTNTQKKRLGIRTNTFKKRGLTINQRKAK